MNRRNVTLGVSLVVLSLVAWLAVRNLPTESDTVLLKNNSTVVGEIVQQEFGKYVVIQKADNSRQVITWDRIDDIQLSIVPWYLRVADLIDWTVRLGVIGGFIIFGVGLWQYAQSQRWKRAEFLLNEIRLFEPKQNIVNVRRILDNPTTSIFLYADEKGKEQKEQSVVVDRTLLSNALTARSELKGDLTEHEPAIRTALNSYFSHLDHFNNVVDSGLVRKKELHVYLEHYLDILGNNANNKISPEIRKKLWDYMQANGYKGAISLLKKFGYKVSV